VTPFDLPVVINVAMMQQSSPKSTFGMSPVQSKCRKLM